MCISHTHNLSRWCVVAAGPADAKRVFDRFDWYLIGNTLLQRPVDWYLIALLTLITGPFLFQYVTYWYVLN